MADLEGDPGQVLEVTYHVENTAESEDTQDIVLERDGEEEDRDENVTLDVGDEETGRLFWQTTDEDSGEWTVTVETEDSSDSITVLVGEDTGGYPDDAIYHWPMSEGSGSTIEDSVSETTGAINGASWVSNEYLDEYALEGDGGDYVDLGTLGSFGNSANSGFTIAWTMEIDNIGSIWGVREDHGASDPHNSLFAVTRSTFDVSSGHLGLIVREGSGDDWVVQTDDRVDDGERRRFMWTVGDASDGTSSTLYEDGVEADYDVIRENGSPSMQNFEEDFVLFAENNAGNVRNNVEAVIDDFVIWDEELDSDDAGEDYGRQPWGE